MAEPAEMATSPRDRMIHSAALLMCEQGVEAMSFSQVLAHSGAPRGSIYHHFPGGKAQLVEEATRYAGAFIAEQTAAELDRGGPLALFDASERFWGDVLRGSDYAAGCPIVAATLEGQRSPAARAAASEVFTRWETVFAEALQRQGIEAERAHTLSTTVFAGIEGGVILARAQGAMTPLERVLGELRTFVAEALAAAGATGRTPS